MAGLAWVGWSSVFMPSIHVALAPRCKASNWIAIDSCNMFYDWRRGHELWSSGHPKTTGSLSN